MVRRAKRVRTATLSAVLCGLCLVVVTLPLAGARGTAGRPADAIVVNNDGSVIAVNLASGAQKTISTDSISAAHGGQRLLQQSGGYIYGVAEEAGGNLIVLARGSHSRVVRVNRRTGAQSLLSADPNLSGVSAVAIAPNGEIYVGDEYYPSKNFNAGGIFSIDPRTGAAKLVTNNDRSVAAGGVHELLAPLGIVIGGPHTLFVIADNGGDETPSTPSSDYVGALLSVNTITGKESFITSNYLSKLHGGMALFRDPRSLTRSANGTFYAVDDTVNAQSNPPDQTRVVKIDPKSGKVTLVSDNARSHAHRGGRLFKLPYGITVAPNGELLVADEGGRLIAVNPQTGAQSLISDNSRSRSAHGQAAFSSPTAVTLDAGPGH